MDTPEGSGDATTLSETMFQSEGYGTVVNEEDLQDDDDDKKDDEPLREQDRFLPIANVARIMKKSIPKSGKIAKDAKECVQECVSEFISFITSEASERCAQEKRKTINGEDILFAMSTLGFDNYVEPLKMYLQKYRESTKGDKGVQEEHVDMSIEESPYGKLLVSNQPLTSGLLTDPQGSIVYATPGGINNFSQIQQQFLG